MSVEQPEMTTVAIYRFRIRFSLIYLSCCVIGSPIHCWIWFIACCPRRDVFRILDDRVTAIIIPRHWVVGALIGFSVVHPASPNAAITSKIEKNFMVSENCVFDIKGEARR